MLVRLLALHAPYQCRHRGVCCREPWAIPVERLSHLRVLDAVGAGTLRLPHGNAGLFAAAPGVEADADVVVGRRGRDCVFLEPGEAGLCAIHRDMGHEALPTACQHFPRVVVLDPRGVSLSLSYVCPTAADLLYDAPPAWHRIVHGGPVVLPGMHWEGLDARDTLPPQVSETRLWDWDALTAFELQALRALSTRPPEQALAVIAGAAARLERDSRAPLEALVETAFHDADPRTPQPDLDALVRLAVASSTGADPGAWGPEGTRAAAAEFWLRHQPQVSRYLASRVMASAVVYHARSATVWSAWLQTAYAVLRRSLDLEIRAGDAERRIFAAALARADRLLVHGIDAGRLAAALQARSALPS
jgi:Fe-S-cluster containining protein